MSKSDARVGDDYKDVKFIKQLTEIDGFERKRETYLLGPMGKQKLEYWIYQSRRIPQDIQNLKDAVALLITLVPNMDLMAALKELIVLAVPRDRSFRIWDYLYDIMPSLPHKIKLKAFNQLVAEDILRYKNGWARWNK